MKLAPALRAACLFAAASAAAPIVAAPSGSDEKAAGAKPAAAVPTATDALKPLPSFAEPAISPDGSEVAFVHAGDIWVVPARGGTAHLLVSHPAAESRPLYSPDGTRLAFVSTRTGNGDVYVLTFATGDLARLTYDDGLDQLDGWSADGKWVYFSGTTADLGASNADVYRVRATGGTPMAVSAERYTNEFFAAPSPDGNTLAMSAGANGRDWWRNGHSNWNEAHVWLRRERKGRPPAYEDITKPGARELWPMWGPGGKTLYCVSDRDGKPQNLVAYDLSARAAADAVAATGKGQKAKKDRDRSRKDAKGTKEGERAESEPSATGGSDAGDKADEAVGPKPVAPTVAAAPAAAAKPKAKKPAAPPLPPVGDPTPLTTFADGRVLWPSISADGATIVFERDFGIWRVPTAGGSPERLNIALRGAPNAPSAESVTYTGGFRDLALSPDGKKVAFVVRGDVFAAGAKDGGRAVRVTDTPGAEGQVEWTPDSKRVVYAAQRGGAQNLYAYDFAKQQETPLTTGPVFDSAPKFSPDGKHLAFTRNGSELRLMDVAARTDKVVVKGLAGALPPFDDARGQYAFSPKGQWLAYVDAGRRGFENVYVVNARSADPKPTQLTFFANAGSNSVSWGADGKSLLFGTGMRTEDYALARVDVVARPPNFGEDQFRGLFEDDVRTVRPGNPRLPRPDRPGPERQGPERTAPATQPSTLPADGAKPPSDLEARPAPTTHPASLPSIVPAFVREALPALTPEAFDFAGVRQRTGLLAVGVDVDYQTITPDGKWCVFVGATGGRQNLYAYPLDGQDAGGGLRQLTTSPGGKSSVRVAADSKEIYFLEGGQIRTVNLDTRAVREVPVQASTEVDFAAEKVEVARQAWTYLKLNFYDPQMHGHDWAAVWATVGPRAAGARTPEELRRILSLMVGELNASHLGVSGGRSGGGTGGGVGRLGLRFDRARYERDGTLVVAEVLANGPGEQAGLKVGDAVLAVDGSPAGADANLDQLLERKIGRRVALKVKPAAAKAAGDDGKPATAPAAADEREVAVRPVDVATEKTLLYKAWAEHNRQLVAKASGGRLGYVHIADMSANALARLNADLDAESATRDGVVVDVRANTGGFVSPFVLDVLSRKGYLTITRRGGAEAPGRSYVGQRALDLPTVLVTNHQSISDAENFAEGYRALKLGKVVGEPTAGGVIFTSDVSLLDGTSFRIPFSKVTNRKGENLESAARPVDVTVKRKPGEAQAGKDSQLDAAVKELLKQVDKAKK
ncbi:MAG: peptidase [Phycisphaerales bacterium]|nr:peptidase [Phycisphaerales bacterium]